MQCWAWRNMTAGSEGTTNSMCVRAGLGLSTRGFFWQNEPESADTQHCAQDPLLPSGQCHAVKGRQSVKSAAIATEVTDGFTVLRTKDTRATCRLYARITIALQVGPRSCSRTDCQTGQASAASSTHAAAVTPAAWVEEVLAGSECLRVFLATGLSKTDMAGKTAHVHAAAPMPVAN